MKVVVQTGHLVGRSEIEYFLSRMPAALLRHLDTIVVYASREGSVVVNFSGGTLGVHCPNVSSDVSAEAVVDEMAVSLLALNDLGHIPERISPSRRERYLARWLEICGDRNEESQ